MLSVAFCCIVSCLACQASCCSWYKPPVAALISIASRRPALTAWKCAEGPTPVSAAPCVAAAACQSALSSPACVAIVSAHAMP
ncbi:Uncharacterised protein [Mycobacteroides abscessus subsp. abscessus]|nr:Uncharacterised protein [Mycobacteroides abscessus subsp. abscessus]